MTMVYFAEPIDQDNADTAESILRSQLVAAILRQGCGVYRPATAWSLSVIDQATSSVVERVNREALADADLLVARLPAGTPSVGVPMEIEAATRQYGIPAIVVGTAGVSLQANPLVSLVPPVGERIGAFVGVLKDVLATAPEQPSRPIYHTGHLAPRTYPGDAGIDLAATEATSVRAGGTALIPTGVRFEFPPGVWGWIVARSSTFQKHGLVVLPGIIDEGYTGELFASVFNPGDTEVKIEPGDRVCQIVLFPNTTAKFNPIQVDTILDRDRGANGFGSTGVKVISA